MDSVRQRGAKKGLNGAKITGGGTGGTVAVFGRLEALKQHVPEIAVEYSRRIGMMPDIFEGTSPGAIEFGARRTGNPRLIDVSLIIEKPDVATARANLRVNDLPADTWLGWLGLHLLAPSIYDILEQMIRDNLRDNGEFQLTRAQEIQRQREGYLALEMTDAQRFDFGTPDDFVRAVAAFRQL